MQSPPKLHSLGHQSAAEKRRENERLATLELKAYRRERKLSIEELAHELGYSRDAVERWLSKGQRVPGGVIVAIRPREAA